jgi:hypothetical protein
MIFEIFLPKNSEKKLAFFTQNKAKLCTILIITLVFEKNANFFAENCRKSQKIVIITSTDPGWLEQVFRLSCSSVKVGRWWLKFHVLALLLPIAQKAGNCLTDPPQSLKRKLKWNWRLQLHLVLRKGDDVNVVLVAGRRQVGGRRLVAGQRDASLSWFYKEVSAVIYKVDWNYIEVK